VMSKKNVLSAVIGLAMLVALPASALAGHHYRNWDESPRPFAFNDRGWHRGWFKHQGDDRPAWGSDRAVEDEDDENDEDENEHYRVGPRYVPPAYSCDEDGDDCEPVNEGYLGGTITDRRFPTTKRCRLWLQPDSATRLAHPAPSARLLRSGTHASAP
jgi:hypothetical protein